MSFSSGYLYQIYCLSNRFFDIFGTRTGVPQLMLLLLLFIIIYIYFVCTLPAAFHSLPTCMYVSMLKRSIFMLYGVQYITNIRVYVGTTWWELGGSQRYSN